MDSGDDAVELPITRQSFRCFWFGVVGVIPLVGLVVGWQALRLFGKVAEASGEKFRIGFPIALLILTMVTHPFLALGFEWPVLVMFCLAVFAAFGFWVVMEYSRSRGRWNPARAWAWGGAILAQCGLALSLLIFETFYLVAYGETLLGVK